MSNRKVTRGQIETAVDKAIKDCTTNMGNRWMLPVETLGEWIVELVMEELKAAGVVEPEVVATVGSTKSTKSVTVNPDD